MGGPNLDSSVVKGGAKSSPEAAGSQMPSAQNSPHVKVAFWRDLFWIFSLALGTSPLKGTFPQCWPYLRFFFSLSKLQTLCYLDPFPLKSLSLPCPSQANVEHVSGLPGPMLRIVSVKCAPALTSLFPHHPLQWKWENVQDRRYLIWVFFHCRGINSHLATQGWTIRRGCSWQLSWNSEHIFQKKHFYIWQFFISYLLSEQHRPILYLFVDLLNHLFSH